MTYLAHRLLCLTLLTGFTMFAGCKSASAPSPGPGPGPENSKTATQEIQIPTPDPESVAIESDTTDMPIQITAPTVEPAIEAADTIEPAAVEAPQAPPPLWSLKYPKDPDAFAGDLDITVIQNKKTLNLTNHTVQTYNQVQVWVNQRYVVRVPSIAVGQTTTISLKGLMNQYGEKYPTPGIFRPDRSFPALLVELVEPDQNKRYRLIVQKTHSQF
ncbi:MAG: hypothetical protein JKX85_01720 [Phycisphaeraceae bacterium]|nr:hypothetical protein [Phycisphaeraceae bacterium]